MESALTTLENMGRALQACEQGHLAQSALMELWRRDAPTLPLPERFGQVLGDLLDRMESSALFTEESCSFSQKDQLQSLKLWLEKAAQRLQSITS